ncbi:MAG TPA: toll/interleukin-1 receptor domain-containing protein [Bryobacteraceae bacterium]|nr:toll/interleukin-1 receptor domain-containing protein [Bryobacteraceae bacterium]
MEEQLRKELAALQPETLLNKSVDALVNELTARYALHVPVLDRNGITELPRQEIQMEVPAFTQERAFFGPGPHYVPATLFTLKVPFSGDRNLLRYPASGFGGHIPAELGDDAVFLTYRAEKPDPTAIKREFDNQLNRIETGLQFVRGPAEEWNNRLPSLIRPKVEQRHAQVQRNHGVDLGYPKTPEAPHPVQTGSVPNQEGGRYDLFLSHASEDKESIARPLYNALTAAGLTVWFDEAVLKMGDSLRRKIDDGLARCRYGIVIISPSFLAKEWPQRELDGLVALEVQSGKTKILPIWHEIDKDELVLRSPVLADRVAGKSTEGVDALVKKILAVIR